MVPLARIPKFLVNTHWHGGHTEANGIFGKETTGPLTHFASPRGEKSWLEALRQLEKNQTSRAQRNPRFVVELSGVLDVRAATR